MFNKLKNFLKRFFLINDTPQKVAGGAALGIFLGTLPGVGLLVTLFFSAIFRLNKLAAAAGALFVNSWLAFLILPPAAIVGGFLFNKKYSALVSDFEKIYDCKTLKEIYLFSSSIFFSGFTLPLAVGFFIVAGIIALVSYFLLYYILKRKHIKHLQDKIKLGKINQV